MEDYELLKHLTPDSAASFLQLIRTQAAEEQRYRAAVVDLPEWEGQHAVRAGRWGWGAGGGRRAPAMKGAE